MKKKISINTFTINAISIICTLICTIFSYNTFDQKIVTIVCFILMVFLLCIIVYLYIINAIHEFNIQKKEDSIKNAQIELLQSIPHLLFFSERKDCFYVEDTGDGKLDWDFHIIKETNEKLHYLYFPVMFEREKNDLNPETKYVELLDAKINGNECIAQYVRNSITYSDGYPIENGCIEVQLLSDKIKQEFDLSLKIRIKNLFKCFEKKEFVIVDIPYITKHLELSIKADSKYKLVTPTQFFEAHESSAINLDVGEIDRQLGKCNVKNEFISWRTQYPKLGYRYQISFSMVKV